MFPWPEGKRAALAVTFDMDAEAAVLAVDEKYARRPSIMTHQQYGPVTAVPRLLEAMASLEIRTSFFIPGFSAERHPGTVKAIVAAGHEICHHGYLHRPPGLIDAGDGAGGAGAWSRSARAHRGCSTDGLPRTLVGDVGRDLRSSGRVRFHLRLEPVRP